MNRLCIGLFACGVAFASSVTAADFSLIILPDTQMYSSGYPRVFAAQTAWIASNAVVHNIRAVAHVGDVVNSNVPYEWGNALAAMHALDGVVPYAMATGNHDYPGGYVGGSLFYSPDYFGPGSPYARQPEIAFRDTNRTDAAYITFQAGGGQWLMLAIPWQAPDAVIDWANAVVRSHPGHTVLIVVHDYLLADGDVRSGPGILLWGSLVRKHRNILMVFCGHAVTTRGGWLASVGDNGNTVYQMLSNYQQLPNGGNGWLRIVDISHTGTVDVSTYSPSLDQWNRTLEHQFSFTFTNDYTTGRTVITSLSMLSGGIMDLQWQSMTNKLYSVHRSPLLGDSAWTSVVENIRATPPVNTYTASQAEGEQGYYRIGVRDAGP